MTQSAADIIPHVVWKCRAEKAARVELDAVKAAEVNVLHQNPQEEHLVQNALHTVTTDVRGLTEKNVSANRIQT
jgi:hypothetical protein